MIAFRVDAGHCRGASFGNVLPASYFTYTDFDKPFTILVKSPTELIGGVFPFNTIAEKNSIGEALLSNLGNDYYYLYGLVTGFGSAYSNESLIGGIIKYVLPSTPLAYPNLYNFRLDYNPDSPAPEPSQYAAFCTFKSTGRSLIFSSSSGSEILDGEFDGDNFNVIPNIYNSTPPWGSNSVQTNKVSFLGLSKYDGPDDFFNPENIYIYSISISVISSSNRECIITYSSGGSLSSSAKERLVNFMKRVFGDSPKPDFEIPVNPYYPVDPSEPSGPPTGNFDDTSDPIPDSTLPTLSSSNTGFTRIYIPTLAQVQNLANYLWTDESVITTIWNHIKQYFEDPMQAMIGFNLVPVQVPDGGTEEFKLMYIGTGVNMTVAASQFVDVDCGTLTLEPYYGSALDYAPYTKISCYLPYIGNVDLDPDEVMGAELQVKYRVDIVSGSCVAKILVGGSVLYQYSGHCAITIPFSAADFASYVSSAISVAKLAIGAATGGSAGAAMASGEMIPEQQTTTITTTERNPDTGRQIISGRQVIENVRTPAHRQHAEPSKSSFAGLAPFNIANTVGQIMGSKPFFQHSGSFSGNTGYLGVRRPYLVIHRPRLCMPESYQSMNGFPSMITMKLGDCTGYTKVQQVLLTGLSATQNEQAEIQQLLKSGVIF